MGAVEISFGILGLIWTFTYTYDFNPLNEMISLKDQVLAELESEHPGMEIKDPFGELDKLDKAE